MTDSATIVRLLSSIGQHLATNHLPAGIASVRVASDVLDGDHVTVHLRPGRLADLASALLEWADTLTGIAVTAWRPPHGQTVHLTVTGHLSDATGVQVFGGIDYTDTTFGDLQPGGKQGVALAFLRSWAAGTPGVAA